MEVVTSIEQVRERVSVWRRAGLTIGFVPTMGALHEGHLFLLRSAREDCDRVVVSIFVNPLQFGRSEDLGSYPRDLEADSRVAEGAGCDLIFAPSVETMYPDKIETTVRVAGPSIGLCGDSRPGHFDGVATVVSKLFNIVAPDRAYFGRKDAQQLAVVRKMTADLNFSVEIVACSTVREHDGLAYSSRNRYLGPEARRAALCLHRGLLAASRLALSGERRGDVLEKAVAKAIADEPLARLDYAELRDSSTIEKLDELVDESEAILAVAAYISNPGDSTDGARLIDNVLFKVRGGQLAVDDGVVLTGSGAAGE